MIAYAAIDLRGGRVVQLVGGRVEDERISLPDPVAVAERWQASGFAALHVVDLDAALGTGSNLDHIADILAAVHVPVQVGGGVRDETAIARLLDLGADRVIVGTRAVEDSAWRTHVAREYPERIVVAADIRDERVATRGWRESSDFKVDELIELLNLDPLAGLLVTDVTREGQMLGIDGVLFTRLVKLSRHPLIAAGGIRDAADLHILAEAGAAGAVLGMALYQGAIDDAAITAEFAA